MTSAGGDDDPALAETRWPMPNGLDEESGDRRADIEWRLRYGDPVSVRFEAAEIVAAYTALVCDGTTKQQLKRLAALRRVHRLRSKR